MNFGGVDWLRGGEWFGLVVAPFVGSFAATAVQRYVAGRPFLAGRSHCDHCGRTLSAGELFPLVGWILLRGRCKACGAAIGWWSPAVEAAYLAMAAIGWVELTGVAFWIGCLLGWMLLALALVDFRTQLLPDRITLPLIVAGLLVSAWSGREALLDHGLAAAIGFLSLYGVAAAYRAIAKRDGLGMGDAKLFAVTGAWLGILALPGALLIAAITALAVEIARRGLRGRFDRHERLAFGPYLALATWVGWVFGPLIMPGA